MTNLVTEQRISFTLNGLVHEMNSQADGILRAQFSLTYSQFLFLQVLAEGQPLDITHLAEALNVTKAAVSKRIEWFVGRDLVMTSREAGNAKRVLVSLTPQGLWLAQTSGDFLEREFLSAMSDAPDVDFSLLNGQLGQLLAHLKKIKPAPGDVHAE